MDKREHLPELKDRPLSSKGDVIPLGVAIESESEMDELLQLAVQAKKLRDERVHDTRGWRERMNKQESSEPTGDEIATSRAEPSRAAVISLIPAERDELQDASELLRVLKDRLDEAGESAKRQESKLRSKLIDAETRAANALNAKTMAEQARQIAEAQRDNARKDRQAALEAKDRALEAKNRAREGRRNAKLNANARVREASLRAKEAARRAWITAMTVAILASATVSGAVIWWISHH